MLPFIAFGVISAASIITGRRCAEARKKRSVQNTAPKDSLSIQILAHRILEESHIILATEDVPMDNRYGNKLFSSEHEFSQTATVSLELGNNNRLDTAYKSTLWSVLESKTGLEISKSLGTEIGSQINRRVRLKFATDPGQFVRYRVVWHQQNQRGVFDMRVGKRIVQLPYMVAYGLSHTVESLPGESKKNNHESNS